VSIEPDNREGIGGFAVVDDPWQIQSNWEDRGKFRDIASVFRSRIMASMAGAEAEIVCIGRCAGGDLDDRYQIALMFEQFAVPGSTISGDAAEEAYEARLRSRTTALVRRHRAKIERLAELLQVRRTVSAAEVDKLLSRQQ
jgi:hypothetical protein